MAIFKIMKIKEEAQRSRSGVRESREFREFRDQKSEFVKLLVREPFAEFELLFVDLQGLDPVLKS